MVVLRGGQHRVRHPQRCVHKGLPATHARPRWPAQLANYACNVHVGGAYLASFHAPPSPAQGQQDCTLLALSMTRPWRAGAPARSGRTVYAARRRSESPVAAHQQPARASEGVASSPNPGPSRTRAAASAETSASARVETAEPPTRFLRNMATMAPRWHDASPPRRPLATTCSC